ncbi:MAG: prolipoprotein diacylglyceryl transferase [Ruminococcaceae bacterium]|nr:prolipoprotein diacylglyceryl transferase [Oscillospiraceae bacterium]
MPAYYAATTYIDPTTISFPGLGIDPFTVDKIAFSIGKVEVRWYGILITIGIVLAFLYAAWRGKRNEGIIFDDVIDIGLVTVLLGVLGARLYYVLTTLDEGYYHNLIDVFAVWDGGLAIYGGIIGGCTGIFVACKVKKLKWRRAFDMIAPGVMIAQALGRWGNFFNGEAYGSPIFDKTAYYFFNTEHALASGKGTIFHTLRMGVSHAVTPVQTVFFHPTFFYECVWNIVGFILINLFYKRKKYDGQIALLYFTWYGFGRMFIEGFRTDSLYIPGTTTWRISQCLGLLCFGVGLTLLLVFFFRKTREPVFAAVETSAVQPHAEETSDNEQPINEVEQNDTNEKENQNNGNAD